MSRGDSFSLELKAGQIVGELSVMDNRPHSADASAIEDTRVLLLEREMLYSLLDEHGEIARGLFHTVTQRLERPMLDRSGSTF